MVTSLPSSVLQWGGLCYLECIILTGWRANRSCADSEERKHLGNSPLRSSGRSFLLRCPFFPLIPTSLVLWVSWQVTSPLPGGQVCFASSLYLVGRTQWPGEAHSWSNTTGPPRVLSFLFRVLRGGAVHQSRAGCLITFWRSPCLCL